MALTFTILGCGSSGGVPRIDGNWGACDPENPKNRRRRCSALIEQTARAGSTRLLIDTSPDMREQLIAAKAEHIDAVLYTHDHADHAHGIDDLRAYALNAQAKVPVYSDATTIGLLTEKFRYCFVPSATGSYPAILKAHTIEPKEPLTLGGKGGLVTVTPYVQKHGEGLSLGYRLGNLAYSPDVSGIPDESIPMLEGLDVWIVDALRPMPHPGHFNVKEALEWIERLKPKRAILTHLHVDLDYDKLKRKLPAHVEPAYDSMMIEVAA